MRTPRKLVVLALVVLAGAAALAAPTQLRHEGEPASRAGLPTLPPGEPKLLRMTGIAERVDFEKLVARAEIVFIGTVADIGGSEVVTPAGAPGEPFLLTRHRVRFAVEKTMRGGETESIGISLLDIPETNVDFEVGKSYLVLARRTELGTSRVPAIVPDGYAQGVYTVVAGTLATNPINGSVTLDELEERLR
jgi:hypothetical protein